jgi:tungstate transport system ATP-binding protein
MMFELKDVTKSFRERKVLELPQLGIDGENITAVVGPNGAGKSTLLRILAFLQRPESGRVFFNGKQVNYQRSELRRIRLKVTLVEQNPFIFRGTAFSNVAYGLRVRGVPRSEMKPQVEDALSRVGLAGFDTREARGLSGGELQRLALARAIILKPVVLLLDEPTAHVDSRRTTSIENLIMELYQELRFTVVFATHDLSQARRLTDRVIALEAGRVVGERESKALEKEDKDGCG